MKRLNEQIIIYKSNMDLQTSLNEKLFKGQKKEDWIAHLTKRATLLQKIAADNEQFIAYLKELLKSDLSEEDANQLYDGAYDLYNNGYEDYIILMPVLDKLIDYYEEKKTYDKLLLLYGMAFYMQSEVRNRADGLEKMSAEYLLKAIALRKYYQEFDETARYRICICYYNLVVVCVANGAANADESYQYLMELYQFWNSTEVQSLDGKTERFTNMIEQITIEWLNVEETIEKASDETKTGFCELAETYYQKAQKKSKALTDINSELYAAYLHAEVFNGNLTFDEIVDLYMEYCINKYRTLPTNERICDEDFYFLVNAPLTLERWLSYGISNEKKQTIIHYLAHVTSDTWYDRLDYQNSQFINEILALWCIRLMKYFDSDKEKEDWIYNLLVRRQLPTYLHSAMVAKLADALCKEILKSNPEIFASIADWSEEELIRFTNKSALIHDIGKTKITDIVNMQVRKLSDREFMGIRKHTEYGVDMISDDASLNKYHDIILGHHKFYDGKGGYPASFDNTKSPYRPIIDLITICDCIDAATDCYGRNYKFVKSLEEVLAELNAEKGTRYNPMMVDVINNSKELQKTFYHLTTVGRKDIMYQAYSERVKES